MSLSLGDPPLLITGSLSKILFDMTSQSLLDIKNICCRYPNGKVVLEVADFHLDIGEVVFLLGPSGIGKSTFIEAIGLINNTGVKRENSEVSYTSSSGQRTDIFNLWQNKQEELESFRREHFSFIFQNNYLMPNLTSGENMMMTLLMKGESEDKALKKIKELMQVVKLKEDILDKSIFNVSGGQKQRLAFVRAIASPFEVLIGDEPTGNLDAITADALMKFTRDAIIASRKSAVFVSHDIQLALNYADRIYLLVPQREGDNTVGHLNSSNMLLRQSDQWCQNEKPVDNPKHFIRKIFEEIV
jgi:ABC-type lipoprotein export system ATPase subunit